jgi:tRNA threonylcarbamoyladenosine biosynthesis protein TsaB
MEKPIYIVGIETSGVASGISLSKNGKLVAQLSLAAENIHSRLLAAMANQIFAFSGMKLATLSAIAISAGPGSFTGLRIGFSLAKGLAHPFSTHIIQVPTLEIYAYQNIHTNLPVLSIMDAHRNDIFCAKYKWNNGKLFQITESHLRSIHSLSEIVTEPTVIVGNDIIKFKKDITEICGKLAQFSNFSVSMPESWALQEIAFKKYQQEEFISAKACQPLYIRTFKGVM